MRCLAVVAGVSMALVPAGCGMFQAEEDWPHASDGEEDPPVSDSDDSSGEPEPESVVQQDIGTCAEGFTRSEINETVAIVDDFFWALLLLEIAASAENSLSGSIAYGVPEALLWENPDPKPEGWRFEGDGAYGWSSDAMELQTVFRFGAEYTFAAADEHPDENLLDPRQYLVGAKLDGWWPGPGTLTFDGVGPYVELLDLGSEPEAPMVLDAGRAVRLGDPGLMDLVLESDISVQYQFLRRTSIRYSATTPASRSRELLLFEEPLEARSITLVDAEIRDLERDRELQIDDWSLWLDYTRLVTLRGEVAFHVDRGHFPIRGTIAFEEDDGVSEVSIECD